MKKEIKKDNNYFRILILENNQKNENKYYNYDYYLINKNEEIQYKLKIFEEKRKKENKILYHISFNHLNDNQNLSNRKYINLKKIFEDKKDNIYYFEENKREKREYKRNSNFKEFEEDYIIQELKKKINERIKFLELEEIKEEIERLNSLKLKIENK